MRSFVQRISTDRGVADLVRTMNCYYSNLIEGNDVHPRDIDGALAADYWPDTVWPIALWRLMRADLSRSE